MDPLTIFVVIVIVVVMLGVLPFAGDAATIWWNRAKPIYGRVWAYLSSGTSTVVKGWYLPLIFGVVLGLAAPKVIPYLKTIITTPANPSTPTDPVTPTVKPTAVTYVYEKDQGEVPPEIKVGLSELNTQNILATPFEEDTLDGTGEVPDQYKVALKAAQDAGLPVLITTNGDKVLRVIKKPTTKQQVLESIAP